MNKYNIFYGQQAPKCHVKKLANRVSLFVILANHRAEALALQRKESANVYDLRITLKLF